MKRIFLLVTALILLQTVEAQTSDDGIFVSLIKQRREKKKTDEFGVRKEPAEREMPYIIPPRQRKEYKACLQRGGGSKCSMDEFSHRGFSMNVSGATAVPLNNYRLLSPKVKVGLSAGMEYQVAKKLPMTLGASVNYMMAGFENYRGELPFMVYTSGSYVGTTYVPMRINVKNNLTSMYATMRWWMPVKYVQPYIIGMGGFQHAGTNIKYYANNRNLFLGVNNDGLIFSDNISSSINWSAGVGVGLGINIAYNLNLDIRATYAHSGKISYYTKENIKNWNFNYIGEMSDFTGGSVSSDGITATAPFTPLRSPIQYLGVNVGLNILFE